MSQILVFGDSIAYGAWDIKGDWVQRLRTFIDQRNLSDTNNYNVVYNLGVDGDTTKELLDRLKSETEQRLTGEENVILISIGSNDSEFINTKRSFVTDPAIFEKSLIKIFDYAKKYSSKVIFIGLMPVDDSKTDPIPWAKDRSYKKEYIKKFNDIAMLTCKNNKIPFVEIFEEFIKLNYKSLLEDGVHPNSQGHKKLFEIVKSYLIKNKII